MCSHENRLVEAILMSTHNIPFFNIRKENIPKLSHICNYGICSKGLKNEFETAVVNEPSVFEPLKFYCSCMKAISAFVFSRVLLNLAAYLNRKPVTGFLH